MLEDPADAIELLVLDVDGVLTNGFIHLDDHGVETKTFHVRDGLAIRVWMKLGYELAIITGRSSMALRHRADELGVRHLFQGVRNKVEKFARILDDLDLAASNAAVIGDDLPDLPVMRLAGYSIAVADAAEEVRKTADFVTIRPGGQGAVREAIEQLLKDMGRWNEATALFE